MHTEVAELEKVMHNLPTKSDKDFARSLVSQYTNRRRLSSAQFDYVLILTERAKRNEEYKPDARLYEYPRIRELFETVQKKLKYPRLHLLFEGYKIIIYQTKTPTVQVIRFAGTRVGSLDKGWLRLNHIGLGHKMLITQALENFNNNPEQAAKIYGIKTNHCCFCARELTNKESVYLGYGPICAEKWGLPHGGMKEEAEQEERVDAIAEKLEGLL